MSTGRPDFSSESEDSKADASTKQKTDEHSALPEAVANFFQTTKSLLNEEEETIIKSYIQQNEWAIRDAQEKGYLLKLSKEAALIKESDGKIRLIPPGAPKEPHMVPLRNAILMYVDQNNDVEGIVLPKVRQHSSDEMNPEVDLLLGEGSYGKVKAGPTIFKQKIVAVKTQKIIDGSAWVAERENEAIKALGGGIYIGGGKRASKKGVQKVVSIMDILKEELASVAPGAQFPGKKISDFKKLLSIAISAVGHLKDIHKQGFIHRDINGHNIMLTSKGQARLVDFGFALDLRKSDPQKTSDGIDYYIGRDPIGTPQFMAPEIKHIRQYSDRSDIFALGIIFSEELCLMRFAPPELRVEINNFMMKMKDPDLNKRPSAEQVHLFLNNVQQKLGFYEAKRIEEMKAMESTTTFTKEAINNLIIILKKENLGIELGEENGNLKITMEKLNFPLRTKIFKILDNLGNEPDGTKLLGVDYECAGKLMVIKGGWISEMSKVLYRHVQEQAPAVSPSTDTFRPGNNP